MVYCFLGVDTVTHPSLSFQQLVDQSGRLAAADRIRLPVDFGVSFPDEVLQKCDLLRCGRLRFLDFICKLHRFEYLRLFFFKIVSQGLIQFGCGQSVVVCAVGRFVFDVIIVAQAPETFGRKLFMYFLGNLQRINSHLFKRKVV